MQKLALPIPAHPHKFVHPFCTILHWKQLLISIDTLFSIIVLIDTFLIFWKRGNIKRVSNNNPDSEAELGEYWLILLILRQYRPSFYWYYRYRGGIEKEAINTIKLLWIWMINPGKSDCLPLIITKSILSYLPFQDFRNLKQKILHKKEEKNKQITRAIVIYQVWVLNTINP